MPPKRTKLLENPLLISATGTYKIPDGDFLKHRNEGHFNSEIGIHSKEKLNSLLNAVDAAVEGKTTLIKLSENSEDNSQVIKVRPAREKGWALVSLSDFEVNTSSMDSSILEQLFNLTPTECAVAFALLEHEKLSDIAEARKISIETVRMHVKNIFMKTGISSQKKLLAMLTRLHSMTS
jgi:DNA-binding CsgD family transcriptional regulator